MIEVTKEEFYKFIGPMNVSVTPVGDYPYIDEFKLPYTGRLVGKVVPVKELDKYPYYRDHYYINR